jgi:glycosyltransferase involved in cell wall biosynthesis
MDNSNRTRVLFVPDSFWGVDSGHRSSQYTLKVLTKIGYEVAVYAMKDKQTKLQVDEFKKSGCNYYEQTPYSFKHQFLKARVYNEFSKIIKEFKPDVVLYIGSIANKTSIDYCIKHKVDYAVLPLTNEYYCVKNFAGREEGSCYKCLNGNYFNAIIFRCLGKRTHVLEYVKKILQLILSKDRLLKATYVLGYSIDQLSLLEHYGVNRNKCHQIPVLFDPATVSKNENVIEDYFVMSGQCITAKGWHIVKLIIEKTPQVKYKLVIFNTSIANEYVDKYGLHDNIELGQIEVVSEVKDHVDFVSIISKSKGVLVPSYYPTTGEFVLLESLGMGKAIIAFNSGVHHEILQHKKNAMVSNIGDLNDFASNIIEVSNNKVLRSSLSKGAQLLYKELTSTDKLRKNIPF